MGWGSKQTTNSNNTQAQSISPWADALQQQFGGSIQDMLRTAKQPVYGDAQTAQYQNNLNDLANSSIAHLKSTLGSTGQLNSGAFAQQAGGIEQNKLSQMGQFFSQLPFQERQAQTAGLSNALGLGMNLTNQAPKTITSNGSQTQTSSPGIAGLLGGALGIGLDAFTGGLGGSMGGAMGGKGKVGMGTPSQWGQVVQNNANSTFGAGNPWGV